MGRRLFDIQYARLQPQLEAMLDNLNAASFPAELHEELQELIHRNWHRLILVRKHRRVDRDPKVAFSLELAPSGHFIQVARILESGHSPVSYMRALDASVRRKGGES